MFFLIWLPVGKNAYAMSVLRRVEMKIDGRDVAENRYSLYVYVPSLSLSNFC